MDGFKGEHLLPGNLGHLFVIISFVAAIVATFCYYKSTTAKLPADQDSWRKLARAVFITELVAVAGIAICLFYLLLNHHYEYKFVYKHSNNALEKKYLLSCFWEGQEGSFWVWIFWHGILGACVMGSAKKWEAPVMTVINFVQIFLIAFLLGLQFGDFHIGSSPFVLLRNSDMVDGLLNAPMLINETGGLKSNYMDFVKDGQGLNILLQNRWMVIHPPTLFLGFASCTIPFAFAVAALWRKDYKGWIKPALPWTVLAVCILGVGILMGAIWAYESLSFGGYWAWDPVENASLVPWLILVAGLHTMLIYRHSGYSLRTALLFIVLTFIFVIYSTYLTRSGDLQETSVHAFTGTGMVTQLRILLTMLCLPPLVLYLIRYSKIPAIVREEKTWSREFWMFIGALVFVISAFFVIAGTSLPVFNKILGKKWAMGENAEAIYNRVHLPIVIILGLLMGAVQYLKYKNTAKAWLLKKILWPALVSLAVCGLFMALGGIYYTKQGVVVQGLIYAALFCSIFSIVANAGYITQVVKNRFMHWGGSLSHLGFGLLLAGILISASNKKVASLNNPAINVFKDAGNKEDPRESLNLFKGVVTAMGDYAVTYKREYPDKRNSTKQYFDVLFEKNGKTAFSLRPTAYLKVKGQEGISPEPDFKKYLHKDVFLYITSMTNPDMKNKPNDFITKPVKMGDTLYLDRGYVILKSREVNPSTGKYKFTARDTAFLVNVEVRLMDGGVYTAQPAYYIKNNAPNSVVDSVAGQGLYFRIEGVADAEHLNFSILDKQYKVSDYISIKVLEFPMINLMWLGMTIMSLGLMISMFHRIGLANRPGPEDDGPAADKTAAPEITADKPGLTKV